VKERLEPFIDKKKMHLSLKGKKRFNISIGFHSNLQLYFSPYFNNTYFCIPYLPPNILVLILILFLGKKLEPLVGNALETGRKA
jgi:hypothetical protein